MEWGSEGDADGQLSAVESVVVDSNDNIYVADFGNNRIQKFTDDGQLMTKWGNGRHWRRAVYGACWSCC
jgi:hypothetical protein